MTCDYFKAPDGTLVIACLRSRRHPKPKVCSFCKAPASADLLCDAELERVRYPRKDGSTTCDAVMCSKCAFEIDHDVHLCPRHRTRARLPKQAALW